MVKVALLVGVSEYQPGFEALKSAAFDIQAMQRILQHPEIGEFSEVKPLLNPSRQQMEVAVYELFANRSPEDLVLFYFSGHGVKDRNLNLYLATPETRKDKQGVVSPTAVAASYLQGQMTDSRSQRQVTILDCCFSGAIAKGLTVKGEVEVDLEAQLGGKGRAILTSSSSTQYSFEQEGSQLSVYTHYLVKGMETGAADLDENGWIDVDELHQYASEKVQEASPTMSPQFYPVAEGYKIYLGRSPLDDPKLKYRKAVLLLVDEDREDINFLEGKFDDTTRSFLDELQGDLGIEKQEATEIETEVMAPYRQLVKKLKRYEQFFSQFIQKSGVLTDKEQRKLKDFQKILGLRDEDITPIEALLTPQPIKTQPPLEEVEIHQPQPQHQFVEIELKSEKDVDYTKLRDRLLAGQWEDADRETAQRMLQAMEKNSWLDVEEEDLLNFPCTDLRTINSLWLRTSNGKFGFSVQKEIWIEVGGQPGVYNYDIYEKFGDRNGWRKGGEWVAGVFNEWVAYSKLTYNLESAPLGHLPWPRASPYGFYTQVLLPLLFSRTEACSL